MNEHVNESKLNVYEDREALRQRPNLMCGTNDLDGVVNAAFEIIYNAIDEAMVGRCDLIDVLVRPDGSIRVIDNGCGVPMRDYNSVKEKFDWEIVFCTLYGSGKADGKLYSKSSGLNGVGATVCNFTSDYMKVISVTDGIMSSISFKEGIPVEELKVEKVDMPNGTMIEFRPSIEVFKGTDSIMIPAMRFIDIFENQAMLTKGLRMRLSHPELNGGIEENFTEFYFPNGVADYFEQVCDDMMIPKTKEYTDEKVGADRDGEEEYKVEMGISFNFSREVHTELVYHNCTLMSEGGTSVVGMRYGIISAITNYCIETGKMKANDGKFSWEDILSEILVVAWTNCEGNKTYFKSQTKKAINNRFIGNAIAEFTENVFSGWLHSNKTVADKIVGDLLLNKKTREENEKRSSEIIKKFRQSNRGLGNKIEGLEDCEEHGRGSEFYIVEGKSAKGSLLKARNYLFQAIFAVRGKTLNCIKKRSLTAVLDNDIVINIIKALGCGVEVPLSEDKEELSGIPRFDIRNMRYEKVMICTDADLDGNHIVTLILSLLWRLVPTLIKEGRVYIVETPLFTIIKNDGEMEFAYDEQELALARKRLAEEGVKYKINRSKGLGEDDAEIMALTAMNPDTRKIVQVTFDEEDEEEINRLFETVLGNDIEGRRKMLDDYMHETAYEGRITM